MQRAGALLIRLPGMTTRSVRASLLTSTRTVLTKNIVATTIKSTVATWPPVLPTVCLSTTGTAEGSNTNVTGSARAGAAITELLEGADEDDTTKFKSGQSHEGKKGSDSKMINQDNNNNNKRSNKPMNNSKGKTMNTNTTTIITKNLDKSMAVDTLGVHHETGPNIIHNTTTNTSSSSTQSSSSSSFSSSSTSSSSSSSRSHSNNGSNRNVSASANPGSGGGGGGGSSRSFNPSNNNSNNNNKGSRYNNNNRSGSPRGPRSTATTESGTTDVRKETMASLLDKQTDTTTMELGNALDALTFGTSVSSSNGTSSSSTDASSPAYQQYVNNVLNDKPYTGPVMDAILTSNGKTFPLNDDDATVRTDRSLRNRRTYLGGTSSKNNARADAIENVLAKRALKSVYSETELDDFVNAVEMQYGRQYFDTTQLGTLNGLHGTGLENNAKYLHARRNNDYRTGTDPILDTSSQTKLPFDIRSVTFTSNLTLNAVPGTRTIDNKVVLTVRVKTLGVPLVVQQYIKLIAGPRYTPRTDVLRMSLDMYNDSASNKRLLMERMIHLVKTAETMAKEYGTQGITVPSRYPRYSHTG